METSSRNGFGTKLLFHRPVGDGLYEATVWVTALYIPLLPTSTWLIQPRGVDERSTGTVRSTTHYVEFIEKRKTPFARILSMYLGVIAALVVMWGPMALYFLYVNGHPGADKTWFGYLIAVPILWVAVMWVWLEVRRDRVYKAPAAGATSTG